MAKKGQKIGPRVTVVFGKKTTKKAGTNSAPVLYSFMRKSTAEYFGFKEAPNAVSKSKKGIERAVRGSSGAGSIKIPVGAGTRGTGKGKIVYKRIPVPNGATIKMIRTFLQGATKNKPTNFVSKDGRTYSVGTKTNTRTQ